MRIVYALVILPTAIMLWGPTTKRIAFLAASFVAGTVISVGYGVIHPPGGDGRALGLTLHPNGLGHTCMLSIALLPFLVGVRPRLFPLAALAGLVVAYGL